MTSKQRAVAELKKRGEKKLVRKVRAKKRTQGAVDANAQKMIADNMARLLIGDRDFALRAFKGRLKGMDFLENYPDPSKNPDAYNNLYSNLFKAFARILKQLAEGNMA